MTWFRDLMGFDETPRSVREQLVLEEGHIVSRANGRRLGHGRLSMPRVDSLRTEAPDRAGRPSLREVVADVGALHRDPTNAGATFQVASQFNLLEMASPRLTPADGVTIYANDHTQGPACALAAVGGTLYRNWFVPIDGYTGQSADRQLDALADTTELLADERLLTMRNGYALFDPALDATLHDRLSTIDRHTLQGALRVGHHADVEVTGTRHAVTQVYGSALPLAYMDRPGPGVRSLAREVLLASYEATLRIASATAARTGNERVFLTLLGGGVFGNELPWILDAIEAALDLPGLGALDVRVVSYGRSQPTVRELVEQRRAAHP